MGGRTFAVAFLTLLGALLVWLGPHLWDACAYAYRLPLSGHEDEESFALWVRFWDSERLRGFVGWWIRALGLVSLAAAAITLFQNP